MTATNLTTFMDAAEPIKNDEAQERVNESHIYSLPETYSTLKSILNKEIPIGDFAWTIAQLNDTEIFTVQLPQAANVNPVEMVLNNIAFIKPDLEFRLSVNGTNMHQGKFVIAWLPIYEFDTSVFRMTTMYHADFDVNKQKDIYFTVPFNHIFNVLDTFNNDVLNTLGFLRAKVLNALDANGASTTLRVKLFVNFRRSETYVPVHSHTYVNVVQPTMIAQSGVGSSLDETIKDVGTIVGDVSSAVQAGTRIASRIGELITFFDNPNLKLPSSDRVMQHTTHGAGGVSTVRLDLLQESRTFNPIELYPHSNKEMCGKYIREREGIFDIITFNDQALTGTLLADYVVSPNNFIYKTATNIWTPTPLSFISNTHQLWRGDIKIRFEFIATAFHKCQFMVSYTPVSDVDPTFEQAKSSIFWMITLSENNSFEITVPYLARSTFKKVSTLFAPVTDPIAGSGRLKVWLFNPLTTSGTVSGSIQCNLYARAGESFQLRGREICTGFTAQSGISDTGTAVNQGHANVSEDSSAGVTKDSRETPEINEDSLNTFLAVPSFWRQFGFPGVAINYSLIRSMVSLDNPEKLPTATTVSNYNEYFASIFMFARGSIRLWFITDFKSDDRALASVSQQAYDRFLVHSEGAVPSSFFDGTYEFATQPAVKPHMTVEFPHFTVYSKFIAGTKPGVSVPVQLRCGSNFEFKGDWTTTVGLPTATVLKSIGPDFTLDGYIGIPSFASGTINSAAKINNSNRADLSNDFTLI